MRKVFLLSRSHRLCRFARRRNEGNKGNLHPPRRSTFCHLCPFCGTISISCGKFFCPTEIKEITEILFPHSAQLFLLFLPFLWDFYYTMRLAFPRKSIFVPRKERKEQKSLLRTARSTFCSFCSFCGTLLSHADSFYCPAVIGFAASLVEEIKEIKEIQVSDVALGRPSASKLQRQELQKVKLIKIKVQF